MNHRARNVLLNAADLLEKKGWTQGCDARDADGRTVALDSELAQSFCAIGAVHRVAAHVHDADEALNVLRRFCRNGVSPWNDAPNRRKEEVVDLLRKAAKL